MNLGNTTSYCLTLLFKIFRLCEHISENITLCVIFKSPWVGIEPRIHQSQTEQEYHRKRFPDNFCPEFKSSETVCVPWQAFVIGLTRQNEINYRRPSFRYSVKTFISTLEQLVSSSSRESTIGSILNLLARTEQQKTQERCPQSCASPLFNDIMLRKVIWPSLILLSTFYKWR